MSSDLTNWEAIQQTLDHLPPAKKLALIEQVARSLRQGTESVDAEQRRANLDQLRREMAEMPVKNPEDGFSNRDHDAEIYGGTA